MEWHTTTPIAELFGVARFTVYRASQRAGHRVKHLPSPAQPSQFIY
ncbi:hypothetical protein [Arthrobacter ulcerisalmonis]